MDEGEEESDGRGEGEKNGFKKKGGKKMARNIGHCLPLEVEQQN